MTRWLLIGLALAAGCKKKLEKVPAAPPPVALEAPVPTVVPEPPVDEGRALLPVSCQRYKELITKVGGCDDALASTVRDQLMRDYYRLENEWSKLTQTELDSLAGVCAMAADAAVQQGAACPAIAAMGSAAAAAAVAEGSRDVPAERGVPLDQATLGPLPHPFGALEFLRPGITRDEILAALPNARRAGDDRITVPLGVEDLQAEISIDYTGHLDVVHLPLGPGARAQLEHAWGPPTASGTWFDRSRRWRADLHDGGTLMIGAFTPLGELLGKGPDGLAEPAALLGATRAELTTRFGDRVRDEPGLTDARGQPIARARLLLPATDVCQFYTLVLLAFTGDRVSRVELSQCFDDEAARRAALAAMEAAWGRVIPGRSADDRPVFTFAIPHRAVEVVVDEQVRFPGWQVAITARR